MLTDIFAERYSTVTLWDAFREPERRLIVQGYRILADQICPYWTNGNESTRGKTFWTEIHDRLAMELGATSLSPLAYAYQSTWNGQPNTVTGIYTINSFCETWMLKEFDGSVPADRFIKERLSLVEIGFRLRGEELASATVAPPGRIVATQKLDELRTALRIPGDYAAGLREQNAKSKGEFSAAVLELNARFRQAGSDLNYHNGFIQRAADALSTQQIETPFWALVFDPKWKNVDTDMKEALDRRDSGARDPAFYAARALESAIKIISSENGWTRGNEKGAHNYIDNLAAKHAAFLADWEAEALKAFFTKVRNPFGHGPGKDEMPSLTQQQTDWAIDSCMGWIKSLIRRM